MAEKSVEERLTTLEHEAAQLRIGLVSGELRDQALLRRIDGAIEDIRRVERKQDVSFDALKADVRELQARVGSIENTLVVLVDTLRDHKQAIETLASRVESLTSQVNDIAAGQVQILALLTGKPPRND